MSLFSSFYMLPAQTQSSCPSCHHFMCFLLNHHVPLFIILCDSCSYFPSSCLFFIILSASCSYSPSSHPSFHHFMCSLLKLSIIMSLFSSFYVLPAHTLNHHVPLFIILYVSCSNSQSHCSSFYHFMSLLLYFSSPIHPPLHWNLPIYFAALSSPDPIPSPTWLFSPPLIAL